MNKYFGILSILFVAMACETIVDIAPDAGDTRYVVESLIRADTIQKVRLTKSIGFYEEGVPGISGALVTITDTTGSIYTLTPTGTDGEYASDFAPQAGMKYKLHVEADGKIFDASTTMPTFIPLEDDRVEFFQDPNNPQFAVVVVAFDDVVGEPTFARVKLFVNGEDDRDDYILLSDEIIDDGEEIQRGFFLPDEVEQGDTISVVLQAISEETYLYYELLYSSLGNNSTSGAPFNPEGNISNDALGYFGAAQMDTVHIIVP